jgi:hypothetical protein
METKLTFKEYLDSKQKLREAVEKTPQRNVTYSVRKYCKLIVGENKNDKSHVTLKPNQKIEVEWLYEDIDNPTPISMNFLGVKDLDESQQFNTYWQGIKLLKWLARNTREENASS